MLDIANMKGLGMAKRSESINLAFGVCHFGRAEMLTCLHCTYAWFTFGGLLTCPAEQHKSLRPLPSDLLEIISHLFLLVAEISGNTEDFPLDVTRIAAC